MQTENLLVVPKMVPRLGLNGLMLFFIFKDLSIFIFQNVFWCVCIHTALVFWCVCIHTALAYDPHHTHFSWCTVCILPMRWKFDVYIGEESLDMYQER